MEQQLGFLYDYDKYYHHTKGYNYGIDEYTQNQNDGYISDSSNGNDYMNGYIHGHINSGNLN